jgi:hypothetical protein
VAGFYNPLTQHDSNRRDCAAEALFKKHPDTSIIATLDEQGKLVFPQGKAFTPDFSLSSWFLQPTNAARFK